MTYLHRLSEAEKIRNRLITKIKDDIDASLSTGNKDLATELAAALLLDGWVTDEPEEVTE